MSTSNPRQSCDRKRRHATRKQAERWLAKTIRDTGDPLMVVYACEFCRGGWHVGHPPKREQRRLRTDQLIALIETANGNGGAPAAGGAR